jgi:hypothetical protein
MEFKAEYRRWVILKMLTEMPDNKANSDILQLALVDSGYKASYAAVLEDLTFFEQHKLVALDTAGDLQVAELTRRGGDVVAGREDIDGIRMPLSGKIGI